MVSGRQKRVIENEALRREKRLKYGKKYKISLRHSEDWHTI